MSDEYSMRLRLQQVAAYRELCRGVRRSGRENIFFALLMLFIAYQYYEAGALLLSILPLLILSGGELLVGLYKWFAPSAEGILLDGIVLFVFGAYNLVMAYLRFQAGFGLSPIVIFLGIFMLTGAIGRFKAYGLLRRLFADRPSPEHMAWFDDLTREILASDPETDELALDLPTNPHWKAKLLGTTVFFVARRGGTVWVAGPDDFELLREKNDHGTGRRKALLNVHGIHYPEFEITDACWANYQKWRAANPVTPTSPPPAVAGPSEL